VAGHDSFGALAPHFQRGRDLPPLERLLYVDLKTWLANDMLVCRAASRNPARPRTVKMTAHMTASETAVGGDGRQQRISS
jgi:hypothetical protein